MTNQDYLNYYFGNVWHGRMDQYTYSGWALIDKIKPGEQVLDVGCGDNLFKDRIPNLLGIDPANPRADIQVTIEDFVPDRKFDVAFCLGSINFGNDETILRQIRKTVSCLDSKHARVYWRCNPGRRDHGNSECESIEFYDWTFERQEFYANYFEFDIVKLCWDDNNRIYAEWVKRG
jgi:hypothetical protein